MNIFEKALLKNKLKNLPKEYTVSKRYYVDGLPYYLKVKVKHITEFWVDGKTYTDNIYNSDFSERAYFEKFLLDNFREVTKIITRKDNRTEIFFIHNSLISSNLKPAYTIEYLPNKKEEYYFLRGRPYSEQDFVILQRIRKFEKIINI